MKTNGIIGVNYHHPLSIYKPYRWPVVQREIEGIIRYLAPTLIKCQLWLSPATRPASEEFCEDREFAERNSALDDEAGLHLPALNCELDQIVLTLQAFPDTRFLLCWGPQWHGLEWLQPGNGTAELPGPPNPLPVERIFELFKDTLQRLLEKIIDAQLPNPPIIDLWGEFGPNRRPDPNRTTDINIMKLWYSWAKRECETHGIDYTVSAILGHGSRRDVIEDQMYCRWAYDFLKANGGLPPIADLHYNFENTPDQPNENAVILQMFRKCARSFISRYKVQRLIIGEIDCDLTPTSYTAIRAVKQVTAVLLWRNP